MTDYEANYLVDVDFSDAKPRAVINHNRGLSQLKFKNDIKLKKTTSPYMGLVIECGSRCDAKLVAAAIKTYQVWLRKQLRKRREVMTTFDFSNREEYLEYRANWKSEYMACSQEIRDLKKEIKKAQKAGEMAGGNQYKREMLRTKQRAALKELALAKIEAAEQYKARKALELEAA